MDRAVVTVVGSSNLDLVVRVPHLPRPGETLLGDEMRRFLGGKGANQAVAARRLGVDVFFVGCVGTDSFGDAMVAGLSREGLDLGYLLRSPDAPSGVAMITVAATGENSIVVAPGVNARLTPEAIERASPAIASSRIVAAQLEIPQPTVRRAFEMARETGARTLLNPAPAQPLPDDLLALVDILVCNETEAEMLTGQHVSHDEDALSVAQRLHGQGPPLIVLTQGSRGCTVVTGDSSFHLPAYTVPVVDTTAAGDAFVGALACRLARGEAIERAARYASAAAALSVGVAGAQPSFPHAEAVARFLAAPPT